MRSRASSAAVACLLALVPTRGVRTAVSVAARATRVPSAALVATAEAGRESSVLGTQPPTLSLLAPAKVNLFLRITKKRDDGFHELASLFQAVSLYDTLDFWELPPDDSQPICSMEVDPASVGAEGIPTDESNLVMRALQLFADRTGETRRIHCRLLKGIPAQAGMGGGSGDAAAALHAANRLAGFPVSQDKLVEWSGELGSDITFFFSQGTAYCTGRGEIIDPRPPLPSSPVYLVKPAAGLSTPSVFKALGLKPGDEVDGPDPLSLLSEFEDSVLDASFLNDLEPPAFEVMPELEALRDDLVKCGFPKVLMSGSGSTVFCVGHPTTAGSWKETIKAKHDVEVYEESFCSRPDDEKLWYGEK